MHQIILTQFLHHQAAPIATQCHLCESGDRLLPPAALVRLTWLAVGLEVRPKPAQFKEVTYECLTNRKT